MKVLFFTRELYDKNIIEAVIENMNQNKYPNYIQLTRQLIKIYCSRKFV